MLTWLGDISKVDFVEEVFHKLVPRDALITIFVQLDKYHLDLLGLSSLQQSTNLFLLKVASFVMVEELKCLVERLTMKEVLLFGHHDEEFIEIYPS